MLMYGAAYFWLNDRGSDIKLLFAGPIGGSCSSRTSSIPPLSLLPPVKKCLGIQRSFLRDFQVDQSGTGV